MTKKILIAALLCAALARAGFCAPSFGLENGIRLASASVHCVTPISGGFRMYFSTGSFYGVFSATSTDGLNWAIEPGVRLSTSAAFLESSSITAMGLYFDPALAGGPYHAYYVGLSSGGYAILSAKSADGLAWTKDPAFSLIFSSAPAGPAAAPGRFPKLNNSATARLRSPRPFLAGPHKVNLYYIRDAGGRPDEGTFRAFALQSLDDGVTFSTETLLLDATGLFQLDVSTLTDGRLRLFVSAPAVNSSTVSLVLAADSADGLSFPAAPALVFSTYAEVNELSCIAAARSTETFRFRLYLTSTVLASSGTSVYSALTSSPVVTGISPGLVYIDDPATDFTVTGEVFSPALAAAALTGPGGPLAIISVTPVSDMAVTVRAVPTGAAPGVYSVSVTNPDGVPGTLPNALTLDFRPGFTRLTDNLFRPLGAANKVKIDITTFLAGNVKARIYTINGGLVKSLLDVAAPAGTRTIFWTGDTEGGRTAASGLYLLRVTGPKLKETEKIVLIK